LGQNDVEKTLKNILVNNLQNIAALVSWLVSSVYVCVQENRARASKVRKKFFSVTSYYIKLIIEVNN
jgi:hypothetical protein